MAMRNIPTARDPLTHRARKPNMSEIKLERLQALKARLQADLNRERLYVSQAAAELIAYTNQEPKDFMVPSKWGTVDKRDDPYAPQPTGGCCAVM